MTPGLLILFCGFALMAFFVAAFLGAMMVREGSLQMVRRFAFGCLALCVVLPPLVWLAYALALRKLGPQALDLAPSGLPLVAALCTALPLIGLTLGLARATRQARPQAAQGEPGHV